MTHAVGPQYLLEPEDLLYFCGELEQAHFYSKAFSLELLTNEAISGSKRANFQGEKHPSALENGSCGSVEDSTLIMQVQLPFLFHQVPLQRSLTAFGV